MCLRPGGGPGGGPGANILDDEVARSPRERS